MAHKFFKGQRVLAVKPLEEGRLRLRLQTKERPGKAPRVFWTTVSAAEYRANLVFQASAKRAE